MAGQKAYASLLQRAEDSPIATFDATALRNDISNLKLDDTWRGTASTFLNKWDILNEQLDSMSPDVDMQASDKVRKQMLVSAVSLHPELASVTQAELMDIARGRNEIKYEKFLEILRLHSTMLITKQRNPLVVFLTHN